MNDRTGRNYVPACAGLGVYSESGELVIMIMDS